jgi:hypothetical protein
MTNLDVTPQPLKQKRTPSPPSSPLTSLLSSSQPKPEDSPLPPVLRTLPPAELLLALPALLAHPPNHPRYAQSLMMGSAALKHCLRMSYLAPDMECRAWTALAEVGMQVVQGRMHENDEYAWASDAVGEVRFKHALAIPFTHALAS